MKAGLLLFLAGASAVATPVDKVVSLLTKLSAQVQAEGAHEAASYDKYACFCKAQADDKVYVIAKSDKKIKELDAEVTALTGEITELDDAVKKSKEDVKKEQETQKSNREARDKGQGVYAKKRKSLEEAVTAVDGALDSMRNTEADVQKQVDSLLQKLPTQHKQPALALIADATAGARYSKPGDATSYKFASKDVIATLTTLQGTFKKELTDLDKEEMGAVSDFEMAFGARSNTVSALEKEINEKETLSASKGEDKSDKDQIKTEETTARDADQKFLDDLTAKCEEKAKAWDKRSTTRASELTALGQAVELLKGMGNAYSANAKLVGFIQLRSAQSQATDEQKLQQLTVLLDSKAHSLKSASLAMLAVQLQSAGPDHFAKVRGIIKDLIGKLEADAKSEATAKGVCDKNMKAAVEKRDKNAAALETAEAQIDSTGATINNLKKDVADLSGVIATLNKELLEAAELRASEKANNAKTVANADAGKAAVDQAITLLNKFYGAFVQEKQTPKSRDGVSVGDAPETFSSDEEYKGKGDASKGIIGMLDVISSDFERTSKAAADAETDAVKDFDEMKADQEKSITDKTTLKGTKNTEIETKESELTGFKDDAKDAKTMNGEALEELEKLTASCVSTGESFAERAAHRKEEIEALKQAMQILEDWK